EIRAGGWGTSPMMERAMMLLPHPLSPTIPMVRLRRMTRSTPSTAFTTPRSVWKCVLRPLISSSTSSAGCVPGACPCGAWDSWPAGIHMARPPASSWSHVMLSRSVPTSRGLLLSGPSCLLVRVRSVPQAVPQEVERQHHDDHEERRNHHPRRLRQHPHVLGLV